MDWTNIIMTLITSGAFTAIYLLGDRKTASVLENVSKTIDQWQELLKEVKEELASLAKEINLPYDQMILYPTFVHFSHKLNGKQNIL